MAGTGDFHEPSLEELHAAYRRVFAGADGQMVLRDLVTQFQIGRPLEPRDGEDALMVISEQKPVWYVLHLALGEPGMGLVTELMRIRDGGSSSGAESAIGYRFVAPDDE